VSKLVLYCFYKNSILYLTQLWFVFFNGYSGTSIHDRWTIGLYNLVFSCMPVLVLAVLDRDVPASVAERYPELYFQGHKNSFVSISLFSLTLLNSSMPKFLLDGLLTQFSTHWFASLFHTLYWLEPSSQMDKILTLTVLVLPFIHVY